LDGIPLSLFLRSRMHGLAFNSAASAAIHRAARDPRFWIRRDANRPIQPRVRFQYS
jgi:hypothetical protein